MLLLQNRDLLPHPTQKLAGVFLLYEMYRLEPISINPFALVFVHLLVSNQPYCKDLELVNPLVINGYFTFIVLAENYNEICMLTDMIRIDRYDVSR